MPEKKPTDNEIVKACENCKHRVYCKKQKAFEKAVAFDENAKCTRNEAETMTNKIMTDSKVIEGTTDIDYEGTLKNLIIQYYDALDLINRQNAEIEELKLKNSNLTSDLSSLKNDLSSAEAEIERLKESNRILAQENFWGHQAFEKLKQEKGR